MCSFIPTLDTLSYLIQASISLDEGVAPTLLQLLQCAICGVKGHGQAHTSGSGSSSTSPVKVKSKKEKDSVKIKTDGMGSLLFAMIIKVWECSEESLW